MLNSGQGYTYKTGCNMKGKKVEEIIKEIAPKRLKPPCNQNCRKKCSEKITIRIENKDSVGSGKVEISMCSKHTL